MGLDFLFKKRQSRRKAWNYQVVNGGQDLLANIAPQARRTCRATMVGALPEVGRCVILQLTDTKHVVVREQNILVGHIKHPRPDLIARLARHAGLALATVAAKLRKANAVDLLLKE